MTAAVDWSLGSPEEGIRLARRRRIDADVVIRDPDGYGEANLRCRDVSLTGLFVYTSACVTHGEEFICELMTDAGERIEAAGRVTRVVMDTERPHESGLGIAFTQLAADAREKLLAYTTLN